MNTILTENAISIYVNICQDEICKTEFTFDAIM